MKIAFISSLLAFVPLAGCSSLLITKYQNASSGLIGCHPDEITIEDYDIWRPSIWSATCENRKYYCSEANEIINCKEAVKDPE